MIARDRTRQVIQHLATPSNTPILAPDPFTLGSYAAFLRLLGDL